MLVVCAFLPPFMLIHCTNVLSAVRNLLRKHTVLYYIMNKNHCSPHILQLVYYFLLTHRSSQLWNTKGMISSFIFRFHIDQQRAIWSFSLFIHFITHFFSFFLFFTTYFINFSVFSMRAFLLFECNLSVFLLFYLSSHFTYDFQCE